jgi:hypothetical protein
MRRTTGLMPSWSVPVFMMMIMLVAPMISNNPDSVMGLHGIAESLETGS